MFKKPNIQLKNLEIYKQIVEHMTEWLLILDENHKTIYANQVFCDIIWYEISDIINTNICWYFTKQCSDKSRNSKIHFETTIKGKSWIKIPIICNWVPTLNWGFVLNISDLSNLKALEQVKKDLIKINHTKDEFVSIVWHELRTPLTSIMWYLSMILDWDMWDINTEVKTSLTHSYNSTKRLITIVNDVLSIWKIESDKMEYYYDNHIIKDLIDAAYRDVYISIKEKWIILEIDFDNKLEASKIRTDWDKVQQVLINLLTNASKFTNKWWKIIIKASLFKNRIVRFEVIDNWIWIDNSKMDNLFHKFSQLESTMNRQRDSWLWLWLSISQNFMKEFWSRIKIKSTPGKWSTFYFDLELFNI